MNKYEKAIRALHINNNQHLALRDLQELVERVAPMKVSNIKINEYGTYGYCPNCNESIGISNHCSTCGQKLDWSE